MRTLLATAVTTVVLMLAGATATTDPGPHFNPDAVLDPSQVTDLRPQVCAP